MTHRRERTVLVTAAGTATAVNVISALRRSDRYRVRVVAVDADPDAAGLYLADAHSLVPPSDDAAYIECVRNVCLQHGVDFAFPLHSSEIVPFAAARSLLAASGVSTVLPDAKVAALCADKRAFADYMAASGLPHPRTYRRDSTDFEFPVFVKARSGSSGKGAGVASDPTELEVLRRHHQECIVQEVINLPELTVDCFISRAGVLVGCVPRYRLRVKDGKSMVALTAARPVVSTAVADLLLRLGYRGACNVQVFERLDGSVCFVEVNPRLAAGGLPLATEAGVNIPELMLRDSDGEELQPVPFEPGVRMMRYLSEVFVRG